MKVKLNIFQNIGWNIIQKIEIFFFSNIQTTNNKQQTTNKPNKMTDFQYRFDDADDEEYEEGEYIHGARIADLINIDCSINDKIIKYVYFPISRYTHEKKWTKPKGLASIKHIIYKIEKYFSESYDNTYFDAIKSDYWDYENVEFKQILQDYPTKGSLLGSCTFIEKLIVDGDKLYIITGS